MKNKIWSLLFPKMIADLGSKNYFDTSFWAGSDPIRQVRKHIFSRSHNPHLNVKCGKALDTRTNAERSFTMVMVV